MYAAYYVCRNIYGMVETRREAIFEENFVAEIKDGLKQRVKKFWRRILISGFRQHPEEMENFFTYFGCIEYKIVSKTDKTIMLIYDDDKVRVFM